MLAENKSLLFLYVRAYLRVFLCSVIETNRPDHCTCSDTTTRRPYGVPSSRVPVFEIRVSFKSLKNEKSPHSDQKHIEKFNFFHRAATRPTDKNASDGIFSIQCCWFDGLLLYNSKSAEHRQTFFLAPPAAAILTSALCLSVLLLCFPERTTAEILYPSEKTAAHTYM